MATNKPKRLGIAARAAARKRRLELALVEDGMSLAEARAYLEASRLADQATELRRKGLTAEMIAIDGRKFVIGYRDKYHRAAILDRAKAIFTRLRPPGAREALVVPLDPAAFGVKMPKPST